MAVRRAAPFSDPDFGVVWTGDHASAWYWSQARARSLLGNPAPRRVEFVPEALFTGAARSEGEELLGLSNGVEGRIWKQGALIASRWWPTLPPCVQWQGFLRSAGVPVTSDHAPPEVVDAPIMHQRWSPGSGGRTGATLTQMDQYLPKLTLAMGFTFVLVASVQVGSILRSAMDIWQARRAAQDLDDPLKRILDARSKADGNLTAIESLLALRTGRPQHRLLAEVARLMAGKQWQLRAWSQPTPDRIEATLVIENPDAQSLVSAWEASPIFSDVNTELSRQQNEITLRANVAATTRGEP